MKLLPDDVGDRIELSPLKYQPYGGSQYRLKLAEQLVDYAGQQTVLGEFINDISIPPALPGVKRVSGLNILGVRISDKLEFTPHITTVAVQSTYALRVLQAHGLCSPKLCEVARTTAVS